MDGNVEPSDRVRVLTWPVMIGPPSGPNCLPTGLISQLILS